MSDLTFETAFAQCPLVAILRGLRPDEAPAIGAALVGAGFTLIEVPLNSPEPFESISRLVKGLSGMAIVGAGTVLTVEDVNRLADAGGQLCVSPNTNPAVIQAAVGQGMVVLPGYYTPSEAFAALDAGAAGLKLFPADGAPPAMLKAHRAVLPQDTKVLAVGGINTANMAEWKAAGADGFGLGSNLYRPGKSAADVARDGAELVATMKDLT